MYTLAILSCYSGLAVGLTVYDWEIFPAALACIVGSYIVSGVTRVCLYFSDYDRDVIRGYMSMNAIMYVFMYTLSYFAVYFDRFMRGLRAKY